MHPSQLRAAVDAVECAYSPEHASGADWVHQVAQALKPILGCDAGIVGWCYDARDLRDLKLNHITAIDVDERFLPALGNVINDPRNTSEMKRLHYLTPAGPIRGSIGSHVRDFEPVWREYMEPIGLGDLVSLNAMNYGFRGCAFSAPAPGRLAADEVRDALFFRVVAHLVTAYRLHAKVGGGETLRDDVEAVLTPGGEVAHAVGFAREKRAREALTRAVRASELARGRMRRAEPEEALRLWQSMVECRWTLVDQFERDGKRYLLARVNESATKLPQLSRREAQVSAMASVGHSNKMIAYELGVKEGTVVKHLARARQKLRANTFDELVAKVVPGFASDEWKRSEGSFELSS